MQLLDFQGTGRSECSASTQLKTFSRFFFRSHCAHGERLLDQANLQLDDVIFNEFRATSLLTVGRHPGMADTPGLAETDGGSGDRRWSPRRIASPFVLNGPVGRCRLSKVACPGATVLPHTGAALAVITLRLLNAQPRQRYGVTRAIVNRRERAGKQQRARASQSACRCALRVCGPCLSVVSCQLSVVMRFARVRALRRIGPNSLFGRRGELPSAARAPFTAAAPE
jgi:hypothetical protein